MWTCSESAMDVRMRVMVPVRTFGEPQGGVKLQGGVFETVTSARSGNRMPAGRYSGRVQSGRDRHDDPGKQLLARAIFRLIRRK